MLDNLRKKDVNQRPASGNAPLSAYQRMQQALNPAPPATHATATPQGSATPHADAALLDLPLPERPVSAPPSVPQPAESVSRLIVGPDIKLRGAEITDCDTLVVEGRVEAAMDSRVIQIADIGTFVGTACVDTADIRGRFDGELTARKQLIIRATGRVTGTIRYGKVSIEEGGELSGEIGAISAANMGPNVPAGHVKAQAMPDGAARPAASASRSS